MDGGDDIEEVMRLLRTLVPKSPSPPYQEDMVPDAAENTGTQSVCLKYNEEWTQMLLKTLLPKSSSPQYHEDMAQMLLRTLLPNSVYT